MEFYAKLTQTRKACKLMQSDVISKLSQLGLDVSQTQLFRWETGRTVPSLQSFFALCAVYHIDDPLSLFSDYHTANLNAVGLRKVAEYRQDLIASGLYKVEPERVAKLMRLYDLPVSAGTGEFLDGISLNKKIRPIPVRDEDVLVVAGKLTEWCRPEPHHSAENLCPAQRI